MENDSKAPVDGGGPLSKLRSVQWQMSGGTASERESHAGFTLGGGVQRKSARIVKKNIYV